MDSKIFDKMNDVNKLPKIYFSDKNYVQFFLNNDKYEYYHKDFFSNITKALQEDIDVLMLALKQDIVRLKDLSKKTRTIFSTEQLKKIIESNPYNIEHATDEVLKDRAWLKKIVADEGFSFGILARNTLCDNYIDDVELAKIASETYANTVMFVVPEVLNDVEIVKNCLSQDLSMFMHLPKIVRDSEEIVAFCIEQIKKDITENKPLITFASMLSEPYLKDENMMRELNFLQPKTYFFLDEDLKKDYSMLHYSFSQDTSILSGVPKEIAQEIATQLGLDTDIFVYKTSYLYEQTVRKHQEDILICISNLTLRQQLERDVKEATKKSKRHKL